MAQRQLVEELVLMVVGECFLFSPLLPVQKRVETWLHTRRQDRQSERKCNHLQCSPCSTGGFNHHTASAVTTPMQHTSCPQMRCPIVKRMEILVEEASGNSSTVPLSHSITSLI